MRTRLLRRVPRSVRLSEWEYEAGGLIAIGEYTKAPVMVEGRERDRDQIFTFVDPKKCTIYFTLNVNTHSFYNRVHTASCQVFLDHARAQSLDQFVNALVVVSQSSCGIGIWRLKTRYVAVMLLRED